MLKRNSFKRAPSMFSEELLFDVHQVWGAIGNDVLQYSDPEDNESLVESCIDADRLTEFGSKESEDELKDLMKQHGYLVVLKALSAIVHLGA